MNGDYSPYAPVSRQPTQISPTTTAGVSFMADRVKTRSRTAGLGHTGHFHSTQLNARLWLESRTAQVGEWQFRSLKRPGKRSSGNTRGGDIRQDLPKFTSAAALPSQRWITKVSPRSADIRPSRSAHLAPHIVGYFVASSSLHFGFPRLVYLPWDSSAVDGGIKRQRFWRDCRRPVRPSARTQYALYSSF
jgi:hypothetical protein